jgi:hypothetical protein
MSTIGNFKLLEFGALEFGETPDWQRGDFEYVERGAGDTLGDAIQDALDNAELSGFDTGDALARIIAERGQRGERFTLDREAPSGSQFHVQLCFHAGEPINLDSMPLEDVRAFAGDERKPATLRAYAKTKAEAMGARLAGDITTALALEKRCEALYSRVDCDSQW